MASKFKPFIKADGSAENNYDSYLEVPDGTDENQNAWLTLRLRVYLNFISSGKATGPVVQVDGKWYAQDADGWLFPIKDWDNATIDSFKKGYVRQAESVWNCKFLLMPNNYAGLDIDSVEMPTGWPLRPNVLCLFRLDLVNSGYHKVINLVRLDKSATRVKNIDPQKNKTDPTKDVGSFDAGTFRSDDSDYDDSDLFTPYSLHLNDGSGHIVEVAHDTIGHEIGHALGQPHILGLEGIKKYQLGQDHTNDDDSYGNTFDEKANIMGKGSRLSLLNAISWWRRIYQHTGTNGPDWKMSMQIGIPPRVIPKGL